jgi:hypothetical protein
MKIHISRSLYSVVLCSSLLLGTLANIQRATAQTDYEPWSPPANLSNSGGTTNPASVIDAAGVVTVVWQDEFAGSVFSRIAGGKWSEPVAHKFPFDEYVPVLIAGADGFIHAFWVNEDAKLLYSKAASADFGTETPWTPALTLAPSAVDFSVSVQNPNRIHLAFIRALEDDQQPAGVYVRQSEDGGASWTDPVAIYQSKYLRSDLTDKSNVQISTTNQGGLDNVFVAWDNRALKRVFLSKSSDAGENWSAPLEVHGPDTITETTDPFNIIVNASGDDVLLVWQAGLQSGFACTQYYQASSDGGSTWSEPQTMLEELLGCSQENLLFNTAGGFKLLQATVQDEVYLLAWNGTTWSDPQVQSLLLGFTDPISNDSVSLRCRKSELFQGTRLFVVGCDTVGVLDIWALSREIGDVTAWFPPPAAWSMPVSIANSSLAMNSPSILIDDEGKVHGVWIQEIQTDDGQSQWGIFYARQDQGKWSSPTQVLNSPDFYAQNMSVALDTNQQLMIVWEGGQSGLIYFSTVNLPLATSTLEWSSPTTLPMPQPSGRSPDILVDRAGKIYVTYAVPLNEGRGIYLITSEDRGATWSEPILAFDAVEAGWSMVESPQLALTNQTLHLLWTQNTVVGDGGVIALYYGRSEDGGQTWSEPALVVEQPIERSWMLGVSDVEAQRFWVNLLENESSLYQDVSSDSGILWSPPINLTGIGEVPGPISLVAKNNEVYLVQLLQVSAGNLQLSSQVWSNNRWTEMESLKIGAGEIEDVTGIAADAATDKRLEVIYILNQIDAESETGVSFDLMFTGQSAAQSLEPGTPLITQTSIPQTESAATTQPPATEAAPPSTARVMVTGAPPAASPVQETPSSSPTAGISSLDEQAASDGSSTTTTGLILAVIVAVVVVVVGFTLTRVRSRR